MHSKQQPTRVIRGVVKQRRGSEAGGRVGRPIIRCRDVVLRIEQLLRVRRVDERRWHAVGEGGGHALVQPGGEDEGGAAQWRPLAQRRRLARQHGLEGGGVGQRETRGLVQPS